jgi:hypothetical protein
MNKNEYRELVKRCINKNIVTSMTSLELPFNQTSKTKPKTKTTAKDYFPPKEMKKIFNSLINS